MGDNDQWIEDDQQLKNMARSFYIQLYTSEKPSPCRALEWSFPAVGDHDKGWLNRLVSPLEIKAAIFQMPANKASGPDGFTTAFFHKFWSYVEIPVTHLLLDVFQTGLIPAGMNESIICLLLKCTAPTSLNHFRPISLCNVLVKAVSKILANHLKPLMDKLSSNAQSSFIPGRLTSDNITAAQEAIHSLGWQKVTNSGFVLKVDLKKAYDRVEWSFLEEVLSCSSFNSHFSALIMTCITSTSLALS